ncbi:hypothetical protein NP233_g4134 [Leucocoprinus birnbaumii]|uniref:F-box domain-containing protein n=1 Tax=Leucocoprinus birnbaumii TaxID=56174 RepID=A0AAD5VXT6_9AGAR|nr:hypothetical protein NP233_g4134 [Leucocoprinus birnbaumii]
MSHSNAGEVAPQFPSLPLEIVEEVATHASDKQTCIAASTVNQTWLSAFTPRLFAYVVLGKHFMKPPSTPFSSDNERLLSCVTTVKVHGIYTALANEKLLAVLNILPRLESLELRDVGFGWDRATLQSTKLLRQVLEKESLKRLSVEFSADHFSGFPLVLVPFCRQILSLSLEDTTVLYPLFVERQDAFSALTRNLKSLSCSQLIPMALRSLRLSGNGLISRFAHFHSQHLEQLTLNSVERLELDYIDSRTGTPSRAVGELLRTFGSSVQVLSISVCRPGDPQGGHPLNTVDLQNLHQLRTLELTLTMVDREADSDLSVFTRTWACHILEALSMKESITKIAITCQMNSQCVSSGYFSSSLNLVYPVLDFALGHQAGFLGLKECRIVFKLGGRAVCMTPAGSPDDRGGIDEEPLENKFPSIQQRRISFDAVSILENLQNSGA